MIGLLKLNNVFEIINLLWLCPAHNKAYALHSLTVVRATPHRAKDRATSHKQGVEQNRLKAVSFSPHE